MSGSLCPDGFFATVTIKGKRIIDSHANATFPSVTSNNFVGDFVGDTTIYGDLTVTGNTIIEGNVISQAPQLDTIINVPTFSSETGTSSQLGYIVTGVGTSFIQDMVGGTITFADGKTGTISSVESLTSLTVDVSQTVALQEYIVRYGEFPTIQSAIDSVDGKLALNLTINVAAGRYIESIFIGKTYASATDANTIGLSIIGDSRNLGATSYLQDGVNCNPLGLNGFGTDKVDVEISNSLDVLTITLASDPQLDFDLMGIIPGDKIIVYDDALVYYEVNVISVVGNTITHDGGTINVGARGSGIILCPNVEIVGGTTGRAVIEVTSTAASISGLWFNSDLGHGAAPDLFNEMYLHDQALVRAQYCLLGGANNANVNNWNFVNNQSMLRMNDFSRSILSNGEDKTFPFTTLNLHFYVLNHSRVENGAFTSYKAFFSVFASDNSSIALAVLQGVSTSRAIHAYHNSNIQVLIARVFNATNGIYMTTNSFATVGVSNYTSILNGTGSSTGIVNMNNSATCIIGKLVMDNFATGASIFENSNLLLRHTYGTADLNYYDITNSPFLSIETNSNYVNTNTNLAKYNNVYTYTSSGGVVTASIDGYTLNVTGITSGSLDIEHALTGTGITAGTTIIAKNAYITGSISGTTLTVTQIRTGALAIGQTVTGSGVTGGTVITGFLSGKSLLGTYTVNNSQTIGSRTLTCTGGTGGTGVYAIMPPQSVASTSVTATAPSMQNSYPLQLITSSTPVNLIINTAAAPYNINVFVGKTFKIISQNTQSHTLTLSGSTKFKQYSATDTNVATFSSTVPYSFIEFSVNTPTSVQVINSQGITFA